jgi:hypothetical protein
VAVHIGPESDFALGRVFVETLRYDISRKNKSISKHAIRTEAALVAGASGRMPVPYPAAGGSLWTKRVAVHTPCRALLVAVATIFLWPLAAVMLLYVPTQVSAREQTVLGFYLLAMVILAWLTVFSGAYVVYPWYRAVPPAGVTDLANYPRRLLLSTGQTSEWHNIGLEWKEHRLSWTCCRANRDFGVALECGF